MMTFPCFQVILFWTAKSLFFITYMFSSFAKICFQLWQTILVSDSYLSGVGVKTLNFRDHVTFLVA